MAALTLVICFPVAAATNSTILTTQVPKDLPLQLELTGNGTVILNGVAYAQSETIEISRNSKLELCITPDAGNKIIAAVYNGVDYTSDVKSGKIILPAITEDAKLSVQFCEIVPNPETGDMYSPHGLVLLLLISWGMIGILLFRKKCIL